MITVLTASIVERGDMLAEACASVRAQTLRPDAHLISVDVARVGASATYNALAAAVMTPWMTFLDDDDLLDPNHLELLAEEAALSEADVVYSWCRCTGARSYKDYNSSFDPVLLHRKSIVPITALVRTEAFRQVGGFPASDGYDWHLWRTLCDAGAEFRCVPEVTWTYRLRATPEHRNQSWGELAHA